MANTSGELREGAPTVSPWVSILGFGSLQAFLFSLFYLGSNWAFRWGSAVFERVELASVLLFMVLAFRVFARQNDEGRAVWVARPVLWGCAAMAAVGSLVPVIAQDFQAMELIMEGALVGVAAGSLLTAWGRVLGAQPFERSVPCVFLGFALASAICFAFAVLPPETARFASSVLPFVSAAMLHRAFFAKEGLLATGNASERGAEVSRVQAAATAAVAERRGSTAKASEAAAGDEPAQVKGGASFEAWRVSLSVMAGTFMFGLSCGFMETYGSEPGLATTPDAAVAMAFVLLFCIAALRSFRVGGAQSAGTGQGERDGSTAAGRFAVPKIFLRSREVREGAAEGPLDSAYRLSVLLMMTGFLLVPVLGAYSVPGEPIVLSGYLGLCAVLASLFLAVGAITKMDAALAFARGFAVLFSGELVGVALGNAVDELAWAFNAQVPYATVALAGFAVLFAYLFLFTERDFRSLSIEVEKAADTFESACAAIVSAYGLSKREGEILPLALRGRTNERIAAELFVSKSTVDTHLRKIYGKCGVHSRQELIDLSEAVQKGDSWR